MANPLSSKVTRRTVLKGLALGAGAATFPGVWIRPGVAGAPAPEGTHLVFGTDPATSMTVVWSTARSVSHPHLLVGPDESFGMVVEAETRGLRNGSQIYHHARVTGLDPATSYRFQTRHDGGEGAVGSFVTAPGAAVPFRFTAFGDQGLKDYTTDPIMDRIAALDPAFHFHVGDLSYASATGGLRALELVHRTTGELYHLEEWDHWLHLIEPVSSRIPWMAAVGNHEMELDGTELGYDGWFARFSLPENGTHHRTPTTYWFRYGNAAFIALDANDCSYELPRNFDFLGGAQERWLSELLAGLRSDPSIDWIVAGYHHCSYCTDYRHGSDGGPRDRWGPLFERYEVDLVINGHNHLYERTHPVAAAQPTAELPRGAELGDRGRAPVYVTSGLGDESDTPPDFVTYPIGTMTPVNVGIETGVEMFLRIPESTDWSAIRHNFAALIVVADVEPPGPDGITRLGVQAMDADGVIYDRFTLLRTSTMVLAAAPSEAGQEGEAAEPLPASAGAAHAQSADGGAQGAAPVGPLPRTGGGVAVAGGLAAAGAALVGRRALASRSKEEGPASEGSVPGEA